MLLSKCDQQSQLTELSRKLTIICEQSDSQTLHEFFHHEVVPFLKHLHYKITDNLYDQRLNDMLVLEYANRCHVSEEGVRKYEIIARELSEQN
jgi:hypothetical protein